MSLVGRESELSILNKCWQRALNGERQIVFVTGEPGIGKTALVDAFLRGVKNEELGSHSLSSLYPKSQFPDLVPWLGQS